MRLILRRDEFRRFWSCLVFLPRERCDTRSTGAHRALAARGAATARSLDAQPVDRRCAAGAAARGGAGRSDEQSRASIRARLEREIADALVSWRDRLRSALRRALRRSSRRSRSSAATRPAFPASYRQDVDAALAVDDIGDLERLERRAGGDAAAPLPPARNSVPSGCICASCAAERRCRSPRCCRPSSTSGCA